MGISAEATSDVTVQADLDALANAQIDADHLKIPPLSRNYQITIHAYASGAGGGDSSTADMKLFVDGVQVAYRHDSSFNTYNFDIEHGFILPAGTVAHVRSDHTNSGADETSYGLEIRRVTPV